MTIMDGDSQTNGHGHGHANEHANGQSKEAFVDGSVAISPNTPELVPGLLDRVASYGKSFTSNSSARTDLLDAARQLVYALETPREAMIRFCWSQVSVPPITENELQLADLESQSTLYACLETAVDLRLFKLLSRNDKPKTASALAEAAGADAKLVCTLNDSSTDLSTSN